MILNGNLKTAIASLRSNKWRSLLTMLGIIIGVSSVVTVVSLGEGLKHRVVGQINQLGSNIIVVRSGKILGDSGSGTSLNLLAFLSASNLTPKDVSAISKLSSVEGAVPIDFVTNSAKSDSAQLNNAFVVGTTPNLPDVLHQKVNYGDFFDSTQSADPVAVIGSGVAQQLYGELNPTGHSLNILGTDFSVRGVLAPSSGGLFSAAQTDFNSAIFIPEAMAATLTSNHSNILQILAKSQDDNPAAAIMEIKGALLKTHNGVDNFTVLKQSQLLNIASGVVNNITAFISGIAAISLLVGGIGIMDIMLVSISERTREIGVRKAIGATNRQILNQFLTEGLVLTIGGGVLGVILALLINLVLQATTDLQPIITLPILAIAVGVSVAVGIIFSVAPALKAARKNPIDALRGE
jgi:putative ABC transport system permease protein